MTHKKIYIVPDGGLANRMRAIASGIYLAGQTGAEPVIVWHRNSLCNIAIDKLFDTSRIPARIYVPDAVTYKTIYEIPRRSNLYVSALFQKIRFSQTYFDTTSLSYYTDHCAELAVDIESQKSDVLIFSGQEFYDYPRELYRNIFKITPAVEKRIQEITGDKSPYLSCQVRRTDHTLSIANSPVILFIDAVREWAASNPDKKFYLATDDESVKKEFLKHYGDQVTFNAREADRSSEQGMIDGLAELMIMSRTNKIYGSAFSSYCVAAAEYGDIPLQIISK